MSWRIVVIENRCKLDCKLNYMVVRGEETKKILIDEIAMVIIENPAISLTGCLLETLVNNKIKIIFCDNKHSPLAELIPYYGSYDCSRKIKTQINWSLNTKVMVWTEIVSEKIKKQAELLAFLQKDNPSSLLYSYIDNIELYDSTNREGHAAKVYFNALFGMQFSRSEDNSINAALNYGYALLLSAFNREISSNGYITQLGLFHDNMFNQFNLACDLMEPFRILIDYKVYLFMPMEFSTEEKHMVCDILNNYVIINNTKQTVLNAIKIYTRSVFDALNEKDISKLKFYTLNL